MVNNHFVFYKKNYKIISGRSLLVFRKALVFLVGEIWPNLHMTSRVNLGFNAILVNSLTFLGQKHFKQAWVQSSFARVPPLGQRFHWGKELTRLPEKVSLLFYSVVWIERENDTHNLKNLNFQNYKLKVCRNADVSSI